MVSGQPKQPGFRQWLRHARLQRGLKQVQLADLLGVDTKTIQRWENSSQTPRPYLLPKLEEALGPLPEQIAPEPNKQAPGKATDGLSRPYDEHASWVIALAWSPDGTHIASAGGDGTVRVWEAQTGESLLTYRGHTHVLNKINLQATVYTVALAPEGQRIVSAGDGPGVHVWDAAKGQTLTLYQGHSGWLPKVFAVAWSPDGRSIASACSSIGMDKTVHIWDSDTGQTLIRYDAHDGWLPNFSVLSLAWSPDGTRVAATCGDKTIRIWSTATRRLSATYRFRSPWSSHIAWSADSRYLASAHSDHTAQVWDTSTGVPIVTYHGHTESIRYVAWSPDGTRVASASNDRTVQVWEALTGKHVYTYRGHAHWATSVVWSPDGTRLASASNDKTVRIWSIGDKA